MQSIELKIADISDVYGTNIKVIGVGNIGNRIIDLLNVNKKLESCIVNSFNIEKNLEKKLKNTDLLFITAD
jgi:cell division GTPase FtsZ